VLNGVSPDLARRIERAKLNDRQPEVYKRLAAEFQEWNATMLPEDPQAFSDSFFGDQLADHFGNRRK